MSIVYYLIDLTKSQSEGILTSMEAVHKSGANQAELSISRNILNTRAIVKVKGDQSKLDKPDPQDVIIAEYAMVEHDQLFNFYYTSEWQEEV